MPERFLSRQLLRSVKTHLRSLGIECSLRFGFPVFPWSLRTAERQFGFSLPDDLRSFYRSVGDGCTLKWLHRSSDGSELTTGGGFEVPTLSRLVKNWIDRRNHVLYNETEGKEYGFPFTDDPDLAMKTAARMWSWLPVIHLPNGDQFSIDMTKPSQPVVFDKHDWLDGGAGDNGFPMADSWECFIRTWAELCFQYPRSFRWPSVLRSPGVDWNSDQFNRNITLPGK